MTDPPAAPGGFEVELRGGRSRVWVARARGAAHGGRVRLRRLRHWLATPEGRRIAARTGRGIVLVGAVLGGLALARRWAERAASIGSALVGGYRVAAGALGAGANALRYGLSLRWLSGLGRWLTRGGGAAPAHIHCPDCHARIRGDAQVCFRCGNRELSSPRTSTPVRAVRWSLRVLLLRLHRRCPDCRRLMHVDARVCRSCGYRLG